MWSLVWLLSLSKASIFICVLGHISTTYCQRITHCMDMPCFIYLLISGWTFVLFLFSLAVVFWIMLLWTTCMWTCVSACAWSPKHDLFFLLDIKPEGITGSYGDSDSWGAQCWIPTWLHHFAFHQQTWGLCLHIFANICYHLSLMIDIPWVYRGICSF